MPTDDENVARIVERRLRERKEFLAEALEALKPELAAIRREIGEANHLKRDFGKQLGEIDRLLREHLKQPMHTAQAEQWQEVVYNTEQLAHLVSDLRLASMSEEQRNALPIVLQDLADRRHAQRRRQAWYQTFWGRLAIFAALLGAAAAGAAATIQVLTYLRAAHVIH